MLATCGWVVAAGLMTTRGFDITDEGFYVLSYRWWHSNLHSFNGAQYLYGPVFDALGHDVAALRAFRLVTVLVLTFVFALAFMSWLATHEPRVRPVHWRVAGCSAIVASGGLIYAWLPLSPGYDDVAALGALVTTAVVLSTARRSWLGDRIPIWLPVVGGALSALQLLAKWSSALNVVVYAVVVVAVLRGGQPLLRFVGLAVAGGAVTAALVHLFVIPLDRALPEMWFVNQSAIDEGGSPSARAFHYLSDLGDLGWHAVLLGLPILAVALVSRIARTHRIALPWAALVLVAFGWFWVTTIRLDGWQGGALHRLDYSAALLALALAAVLASAGLRRPSAARHAPVAMLLLIPFSQAFGTSNPLWMVAADAFAAWFAVVIWFLATSRAQPAGRLVAWLSAASVPALVAIVVCTGLLAHPYRTTGFEEDTAAVPGLASVRVSPEVARQYAAVRHALEPYLRSSTPTPIYALDRMSGLIFILGGTAAGESWNGSPLRSGMVLRRACEQDEVGPDNPPILMFNRPVTTADIEALADCGLGFPDDFTRVPDAPERPSLFVPR
jgi:hypothetical protein